MLRADFNRNLNALQEDLIALGSLVERATTRAMRALQDRDLDASQQVVDEDDVIDQKCYQLEDQCIDLIATQQPNASDLRMLVTVLQIAVELERMGDYAEGIAKISVMMGEEAPLKPLIDLPLMAEKGKAMLRRSLAALVSRDTDAAVQVCQDDDEVDDLYDRVYRDLLDYMIDDPHTIQRATYLLWVAHDLERIADRATNIAERVIYLVTGRGPDVHVSKY